MRCQVQCAAKAALEAQGCRGIMIKRLLCISLFALSALCLYARGAKPYYIKGDITTSSGGGYSYAGLELQFYNKSEKDISSFTIVFRLCDEDGLSPFDMEYISVNINECVKANESTKRCISLDDLFDEAPDAEYEVESLFVEKITYEDGSVWRDGQ